jgi:hypothetical protein
MKIKNFYHLNQFILIDWNTTYFQSYNSMVAKYEIIDWNRVLTLGRDRDYSNTTLKHLYLFIREIVKYYWVVLNKNIINKAIKDWKLNLIKIIYNENL